ncbi:MAG: hypothetical protein ACK4YU_03925 [Paracoccus sp. (in: a-proteobacteria)]
MLRTNPSLLDLVAVLGQLIPDSDRGVTFRPARSGDFRYSRGDDRHMQSMFGAIQDKSLSKGLAEIIEAGRVMSDADS